MRLERRVPALLVVDAIGLVIGDGVGLPNQGLVDLGQHLLKSIEIALQEHLNQLKSM